MKRRTEVALITLLAVVLSVAVVTHWRSDTLTQLQIMQGSEFGRGC